jgi:hypothetical protein
MKQIKFCYVVEVFLSTYKTKVLIFIYKKKKKKEINEIYEKNEVAFF